MVTDAIGITIKYPSSTEVNNSFAFPVFYAGKDAVIGVLQSHLSVQGTFTSNVITGTNIIGWWEFEPENENGPTRIFVLPNFVVNSDITRQFDCEMNQSETNDQGYVSDQEEWKNVEMTSWFFVNKVNSNEGSVFMEARVGKYGSQEGGCCQDTAYGVDIFWDNSSGSAYKGNFQFYKFQNSGAGSKSPIHAQSLLTTFYQKWFGAKFCVYNMPSSTPAQPRVRLELWLTPIEYEEGPGAATNNRWTRVGIEEDYPGKGWGRGGLECRAPTDDFPISWACPFVMFGWTRTGDVIRFHFTSFREIDPEGSFGEDPLPPPDPGGGLPDPDPDPGTPPPPPPDAEPPKFPTTMTKRLTIRREIINNRLCSCDGVNPEVPVPPGPPTGGGGGGGGSGGGGGGGTGTLITLYNVALNTATFARLALVAGSSSNYLRFGQGVTQTNSPWIGKAINRVEITIADVGNPTGSTGGGVHCRIRKGTDDTIAATLSPVASDTEILAAGKVFVFENLTNTYKMAFNDKLLFEYDGGNSTNYVKIFMTEQPVTTGTKIVWQTNAQDPGEYSDEPSLDICARVYTLTP